jgi:hypothetical protein
MNGLTGAADSVVIDIPKSLDSNRTHPRPDPRVSRRSQPEPELITEGRSLRSLFGRRGRRVKRLDAPSSLMFSLAALAA